MRTALGEPLHNIPDNILNRVISKSIQADLRKYKMGTRAERITGGGTTTTRDRTRSPGARSAYDSAYDSAIPNTADLSREVSAMLGDLSTAANSKMSLIKMQVIKCDETANNFKRMRNSFNVGNMAEADRIMAQMDESNHQSLLDLQNEISDGHNMISIIAALCDTIKREKRAANESSRGRSPGGGQSYAQTLRNRSNSTKRGQAPVGAGLTHPDYAKYDSQIAELRRTIVEMESENQKLRNTMREMVDDYSNQLQLRDDQIRRFETDGFAAADTYKNEALALRDKVASLNRQLDMASAGNSESQHLRDEVDRLNRMLHEKDRMLDSQMNNQKTEWAEIYAQQKQNLDGLERENGSLRAEVNHLKLQVDLAEKKAAAAPNFGGTNPNETQDFAET